KAPEVKAPEVKAPEVKAPEVKAPATPEIKAPVKDAKAPAQDGKAKKVKKGQASIKVSGEVEPIAIKREVKKGLKPLIDTLARYILDDELDRTEMRKAKNGVAFLHLAATHKDPNVVIAALQGMSRTWQRTSRGKSQRPVIDADFEKVVLGRLQSKIPQVREAAFAAVRLLLGGDIPNANALKLVLSLVNKGATPADRVAAIAALYNIKDYQLPKPRPGDVKVNVVSAVLGALEAKEIPIVANALHSLSRVAYKEMPKANKLLAALALLEKHPEASLKGAAMVLAAQLTKDKKGYVAKLLPMLKEKEAYLRAVAVSGLGALGDAKAIHALIPLLDDGGKNFTEVRYQGLSGRAEKIILRTPGGRQINEGVLFAMQRLTEGTAKPFTFESLGGKGRAARRDKAIADAKAWYTLNKATLPKP
ncbi:hypothetical protein KKF91_12325, partial [Myxococcota bacterium]|nr:hypothetical protein [Myxococcota bacterium]